MDDATNRPLRVAVWSTGGIGSIAIAAIQRRPNLARPGVLSALDVPPTVPRNGLAASR